MPPEEVSGELIQLRLTAKDIVAMKAAAGKERVSVWAKDLLLRTARRAKGKR